MKEVETYKYIQMNNNVTGVRILTMFNIIQYLKKNRIS